MKNPLFAIIWVELRCRIAHFSFCFFYPNQSGLKVWVGLNDRLQAPKSWFLAARDPPVHLKAKLASVSLSRVPLAPVTGSLASVRRANTHKCDPICRFVQRERVAMRNDEVRLWVSPVQGSSYVPPSDANPTLPTFCNHNGTLTCQWTPCRGHKSIFCWKSEP